MEGQGAGGTGGAEGAAEAGGAEGQGEGGAEGAGMDNRGNCSSIETRRGNCSVSVLNVHEKKEGRRSVIR